MGRPPGRLHRKTGRHVQAGLYPNPDLAFLWDEIGDRTSVGGSGIVTAPRLTQTIVTGRKLSVVWGVHCVVAEDAHDLGEAPLTAVASDHASQRPGQEPEAI